MSHANKRRTLLAALLVLAAPVANADQLNVILNGKSFHVGADYNWNEDNHGIGFEYEWSPESRWVRSGLVNAFSDSLGNMSYMAGAGVRRRLLETDRFAGLYLDAGVVAFLMQREHVNDDKPFPGLLPVVAAGNRHIGLNLTYVPKMIVHDFANAHRVDPSIRGVFFLQAKFSLGWND